MKTLEEKARAYDKALERARKLYNSEETSADVEIACENIFPELAESEDERIRKAIITFFESEDDNTTYALVPKKDILAWLEKQGNVNALIQEAAEKSYTEGMRVERKRWIEKQGEQKQEENDQKCEPFRIKKGEWYVCIHDFCNKAIRIGEIIQAEHDDTIRGIGFLYMENKYFRPAFENEIPQKPKWSDEDEERLQSCIIELQGKGLMGGVDTIDTKWLKSLKQRIHDNFEKTCKNDTLLDLLNKIPSCITVDGIDYHFVMKKSSYYLAYYKGNKEEYSGNAIFGVTSFSPIDLLTEMLEILKEKGL